MFESGNRKGYSQSESNNAPEFRHLNVMKFEENSKPVSQSRTTSLPAKGFSRVYPAKKCSGSPFRSHEAEKEMKKDLYASPVSTANGRETELDRSSSRSSDRCSQKTVTTVPDSDSSEISGDVSSIIMKFNGRRHMSPSSAVETHAKTTRDQRNSHGGRSRFTGAQSPSVQSREEDAFSVNDKRDIEPYEISETAPQRHSTASSPDHWQYHQNDWTTTGRNVDEDADQSSDVTSDISTPTSGYATDQSSDNIRHEIKCRNLQHKSNDLSLSQLRLRGDNGSDCIEPVSQRMVIRTFEACGEEDIAESDHPYFARLAAETQEPTPILSRSGSFRGVKNRVRAGIASLLDKKDGKASVNYSLLEKGKIVFYTTSVTVVRETFDKCYKIKRILQTQMVEYDERNVFMSKDAYQELSERLHSDVELPQVFIDGHHLGEAEEIERLNENGTLRKIFSNFKKVQQQPTCCSLCGGYRFIPCFYCHGSKKSKRNCFTDEFCALRCIKCDDNGLMKCNLCNIKADDTELGDN